MPKRPPAPLKKCSTSNCDRLASARGMCTNCYQFHWKRQRIIAWEALQAAQETPKGGV